jgi:hypothetical protein
LNDHNNVLKARDLRVRDYRSETEQQEQTSDAALHGQISVS